jgi:hypothetical protein
MKPVTVTLLLFALSGAARAEFVPQEAASARSMSGQFIVGSSAMGPVEYAISAMSADASSISLEPSLLVVSCERIKQAVWSELGVSGRWSGRISISLRTARSVDDPVTIVCNRFRDVWGYQLDMPQTVDRRRFLGAIVRTVLLELANRNSGARSAEIPAWLGEGLTEQLLASRKVEIMLPPPRKMVVQGLMMSLATVDTNKFDPLETARRTLKANPPLTLGQLSWPTGAQLAGDDGGVYHAGAQVFVSELLHLRNGPACMSVMLNELGQCYNWQTAFFRAFKPHFTRLLDLEKWWALQQVSFTGNDPTRYLSREESWRKLDEILVARAEVRHKPDEMPSRSELTLQTAIVEWDFALQRQALENKSQALDFLRFRIAPELAGLLNEYRQTLADYLKRRGQAAFTLPGAKPPAPTVKGVVQETLRQLNALDEKRMALKPQPGPTTAAQ